MARLPKRNRRGLERAKRQDRKEDKNSRKEGAARNGGKCMRYFFQSKVEKEDRGYMIHIPFNVWEVCKQRDIIKGDVVLDNRHIDCELLPKDKGNYEIHIKDEDGACVELGVPHMILLHITDTLIRMDQNSPYSFENPIRKIDGMKVIIQPEDGLCGQTCVAMLAGVAVVE